MSTTVKTIHALNAANVTFPVIKKGERWKTAYALWDGFRRYGRMGDVPEILQRASVLPPGKKTGNSTVPAITRATMANWVIHNSEAFFLPMYEYFHRKLLEERICNGR